MKIAIKGGLGAVIVGAFGLLSIWNGGGMVSDCLRSVAYRTDLHDKIGTDPVVGALVMIVVGIISMACITEFETGAPKKKVVKAKPVMSGKGYRPSALSIALVFMQIVGGAKMLVDCIHSPAMKARIEAESGINPIGFAIFAIVWGVFVMAWIAWKASKGGGSK